MMRDPIVVVGAGPVGLVAALYLARAGLPVVLLEKRRTINMASRASTWHPPTLDILASLGVGPDTLNRGQRVDAIEYRMASGEVKARLDFSALQGETNHPFRLHLEQAIVSDLLLVALDRYPNVKVILGAEAVGLGEGESNLPVIFSLDDSKQTLNAHAVLVCDGAGGPLGPLLGAYYSEQDYPGSVLRLQVRKSFGHALGLKASMTYAYDERGVSVSFLEMPDTFRILLRVPEGVADEEALSPTWHLPRLKPFVGDALTEDVMLVGDVYRAKKRTASDCQFGRAFIIGDAAHLTNTRGGMNMNAGIHDAVALAEAIRAGYPTGDLAPAAEAARYRHAVWRDQLIPRSDMIVSGGLEWLDRIRLIAENKTLLHDYLFESSMLDMIGTARTPNIETEPSR